MWTREDDKRVYLAGPDRGDQVFRVAVGGYNAYGSWVDRAGYADYTYEIFLGDEPWPEVCAALDAAWAMADAYAQDDGVSG